jgi:hypothetical protein
MQWRHRLPACLIGALGLATASCGAASPSGATSDSPPVYLATSPGFIRQVTFTDETHFSWNRVPCVTRETGCSETGTYAIDSAGDSITFTVPQPAVVFGYGTAYSVTLPFQANATPETQSVHIQGDGLTTTSPGSLTGGGSNLGSAIQVGNQSFAAAAPGLVSSADGGTALVMPVTDNWVPPVVNQQGALLGGAVLAPTVITVSWTADPNAATWEGFDDALSGSSYWTATTSEYGVGPLTSGPANHFRLKSKPPTSMSTETLPTWLSQQMAAKVLPYPTANSYYALYLAPATSARYTEQGQKGCENFGGEHMSTTIKGVEFAFAIMLQCSGDAVSDTTVTASHELVEGSADPLNSKPAYIGFDSNHLAWDVLQDWQDEIADACEFFPNINTTLTAGGKSYQVQRTWSDAAAAQGHDPCVPAPSGAYFNISPANMTTITINTPKDYISPTNANSPKTLKGLGYSIKAGQTLKIPIHFLSDTPSATWTISAAEGAPQFFTVPKSHNLTLSLDKTSGSSGTIANLTVKVNSTNTSLGGELITITSTMNGVSHYAPILISQK